MSDVGLVLTFENPGTAVAFARELERSNVDGEPFRIAAFDSKLNFDAETLVLVLKIAGAAGAAAGGLAGFMKLTQEILRLLKKPSVKMEIDGKQVELHAAASDQDVQELCAILLRSNK